MDDSSASISHVSDTAFWVAYYRHKESGRPDALFRDPLALRLVGSRGKAISDAMPDISRYTEWSVVARTVLIDRFITELVGQGVDAVVNLGAGLDTRPYRMDLPPELHWIEADRPAIIEHKTAALASEAPRCQLTRVAIDLADGARRRAFLESAAPGAKKVLILTEGVIPYLSPAQVAELGRDLRAQPRFAFWITEYFHPKVYRYLRDPTRMAAMKNAPFLFFPEDWYGFFAALGWTPRETRYSGDVAVEFQRTPPMPWLARLLLPLMPAKAREVARKMTGFVVFERGPEPAAVAAPLG